MNKLLFPFFPQQQTTTHLLMQMTATIATMRAMAATIGPITHMLSEVTGSSLGPPRPFGVTEDGAGDAVDPGMWISPEYGLEVYAVSYRNGFN